MGKKIWSLEKLQKIVEMLLEPDLDKVAVLAYGARGTGDLQESTSSKSAAEGTRLLQLLQHERVHGPSDRDHTVASNELIYFKGPYIYVYDIEEKQKPIMVREYAKVADKKDGDWPQFRTAGNGRCPFVEDGEVGVEKKQKREPERVSKASVPPAATLKPPPQQSTRSITGKRTLMEMEDGSNRGAAATTGRTRTTDTSKISNPPSLDFQPQQNAFTSRAREARLFAGEPVASGVQPSNITSAVKSAMISSTTGGLAPKAGTSKEMYRLQRKVLQRNSVPLTSGTSSSRRVPIGESGQHDTASFMRSNSMGRPTSTKLQAVEEEERRPTEKLRRTASVPVSANQTKPKKKELKPGYCENCQDKFEDFDQVCFPFEGRKVGRCTRSPLASISCRTSIASLRPTTATSVSLMTY
jgi:regulatory subunit for Cdc7p protein kinase